MNKEILSTKGFKLNRYPEGSYYEYETTDTTTIEKILDSDYFGNENIVILQLKEDLSNKLLCIDCNTWSLSDVEFQKYLDRLN